MRHIFHPHRKTPTPYTRALREVLHPAKGAVTPPEDVTRAAWKETHTPKGDPSHWPNPWPLDPQAPRYLKRRAEGDCTPTPNPLTSAPPCHWEEDALLRAQARERYPYPECNQWGAVPPEYIEDCKEVDRRRREWIEEQKTQAKPTQNPGETHSKPMGYSYETQLTKNQGQDVTRDHVGVGPALIHTPDPQYFTNDTLRPTPKGEGIAAREEGVEEQWKRRELDRHRKEWEEQRTRENLQAQVEYNKSLEKRPKIPPFPPGGYIPSLEDGLIPKSLQDAIARAAGKTAEEMRKVVEDACALKTPRRPCLEDLPLADLYALWKLLRRQRKAHRHNAKAAATLDHKILAVYDHIHHRMTQIDY